MKKVLIAIILLPIVGLGALHGGLWYFSKQAVDKQIIKAKPFVDITYKTIKTSLTGTAKLEKIKLYIPMVDESIFIESVDLITPDLITLVTLDNKLKNNELPESLTLNVTGFEIDLKGSMMTMMDSNKPGTNTQTPGGLSIGMTGSSVSGANPFESLSTLACGDVEKISGKALLQMGYEKMISDITLNYRYNPHRKTINYTLKNNLRDMTKFSVSGQLNNIRNTTSLSNKQATPGKITVDIVDDSYIKRKNKFCAKQGRREVAQYINDHIKQIQEYLTAYGITIEDGLLNAYRTVLEKPGSITFEADLGQLTGTQELVTFKPNDFIQFVRLKLFVNGKRVNEISIDVDKEKLIATATGTDATPETPDVLKKKVKIQKYRPVSTQALLNYDGFKVKLKDVKGKQYKGKLSTSDPTVMEVISRLRSGNISYHIPMGDIKAAEVYF